MTDPAEDYTKWIGQAGKSSKMTSVWLQPWRRLRP